MTKGGQSWSTSRYQRNRGIITIIGLSALLGAGSAAVGLVALIIAINFDIMIIGEIGGVITVLNQSRPDNPTIKSQFFYFVLHLFYFYGSPIAHHSKII